MEGRGFQDTDGPDAPPVTIVSEAMARRFWPDGDAVGRILRRPTADLRVVGVAADIKVESLGESPTWLVYLPYTQNATFFVYFVARTSGDAQQAALAMAMAGRALDPNIMVLGHDHYGPSSGDSATPGAVGRPGGVDVRGPRAGARGDRPVWHGQLRRRLVLVGSVIGLALSLLVSRLLGDLLVDTRTTDLTAFLGAPLVLGATALLASYLPARRASRADPITA